MRALVERFYRRWFSLSVLENRGLWLYGALAAPLLGLLLLAFSATPLLERLEWVMVDLRFRFRAPHDPPADERLILVGIDEASLEKFGRWPWLRERHGDFCKVLAFAEPAVVAFDVLFTEPGEPEDDRYFFDHAGDLPRLITGAMTADGRLPTPETWGKTQPLKRVSGKLEAMPPSDGALLPLPDLRERSWFGFVNSEPTSADGIRRRIPLVVRAGGEVFPSLALQALMLYWEVKPEQVEVSLGREVVLPTPEGVKRIPINAAGEMGINYRNKEGFAYWSYVGLLSAAYFEATGEQPFPAASVHPKGKILVVGQVASGLSDLGPSPLESKSPLVLASMNAMNAILRGDYLREVPLWPWSWLLWLGTAWGTVRVLLRLRGKALLRALFLPLGLMLLYIGVCWGVFWGWSVMLPVAAPVLGLALLNVGAVLARWFSEILLRRRLSVELERTAEAKKRIEQELAIAREIQMSTLPMVFPAFPERPEIDLHASIEPAKAVGGDLYDFFFVNDDDLFFVIGDVCGKGVPAALFMTMALSVLRSHAIAGRGPAETLRRSNNVLAMRNERCSFVTVFCGILNTRTGHVRYANGGHNPPLRFDGYGGVEFLEEEGVAIGAMEGFTYNDRELTLKPHEGLLLYTDGVTEAFDPEQSLFETERLEAALRVRQRLFSAQELNARLRQKLEEFVRGAEQSDDITMLTLVYRG